MPHKISINTEVPTRGSSEHIDTISNCFIPETLVHSLEDGRHEVPDGNSLSSPLQEAQDSAPDNISPNLSGPDETRIASPSQNKEHQRLSVKETLSITGCITIIGGSVLLIGILGFLIFLFFGHGPTLEAKDAPYLWRVIVLKHWMIRSITLTLTLTRFIVSTQATICTSMIAALIIEQRLTKKSNIAFISVMRAINNGPSQLLELIFSSTTADVQTFLGSDTQTNTTKARGILHVDYIYDPNNGPAASVTNTTLNMTIATYTERLLYILFYGAVTNNRVNETFGTCWFSFLQPVLLLYPETSMVFQDTLFEMRRAALAFQNFATIMALSVYNEYLSAFVQLEEVETSFAMRAQAPGPCYGGSNCPGFIFIATMISLYLTFVAAITILYIKRVRYSRVGNIWNTISQLVSEELREFLEEGNDANDKTAAKKIAQDVDILVKIDRSDNDGAIKVVKHSYRQECPHQE